MALVPRLTAQNEIARGQVVALTVREMKFERRLHLVYRKGGSLSHAARAFLQVARRTAEERELKIVVSKGGGQYADSLFQGRRPD